MAAAILAYAGQVGDVIVAPSRVDEVLVPDGELTVDSGVFRSLFGKPITGTLTLRDLYGRDGRSQEQPAQQANPSGTEKPANAEAKP